MATDRVIYEMSAGQAIVSRKTLLVILSCCKSIHESSTTP